MQDAQAIITMRAQGCTLQYIGDRFGVSRQRIRQLLKRAGVDTPGPCEMDVIRAIGCSPGHLATLRRKGIIDPQKYGSRWIYSDNDIGRARQAYDEAMPQRVVLQCAGCGTEFSLLPSTYRARAQKRKLHNLWFCSRECFGRYLGMHWGAGARTLQRVELGPEAYAILHDSNMPRAAKIRALYAQGFPKAQIRQDFGFASGTVYQALQRKKKRVSRDATRHLYCPLCGEYFSRAVDLARHRTLTGELNDPACRRKILGYWRGHTTWETLAHFHLSQEAFRSIREGRQTSKHH